MREVSDQRYTCRPSHAIPNNWAQANAQLEHRTDYTACPEASTLHLEGAPALLLQAAPGHGGSSGTSGRQCHLHEGQGKAQVALVLLPKRWERSGQHEIDRPGASRGFGTGSEDRKHRIYRSKALYPAAEGPRHSPVSREQSPCRTSGTPIFSSTACSSSVAEGSATAAAARLRFGRREPSHMASRRQEQPNSAGAGNVCPTLHEGSSNTLSLLYPMPRWRCCPHAGVQPTLVCLRMQMQAVPFPAGSMMLIGVQTHGRGSGWTGGQLPGVICASHLVPAGAPTAPAAFKCQVRYGGMGKELEWSGYRSWTGNGCGCNCKLPSTAAAAAAARSACRARHQAASAERSASAY